MKKIFSTVALAISALFLFAQTQIQVPQVVTQAFKDGHNTHDFVTWTMDGPNYKANSIDAMHMHHINVYDANGNLLRSESELSSDEIPVLIKSFFNKDGITDFSVWMVEDKGGKRSYFSAKDSEIIHFDSEGNSVKN